MKLCIYVHRAWLIVSAQAIAHSVARGIGGGYMVLGKLLLELFFF